MKKKASGVIASAVVLLAVVLVLLLIRPDDTCSDDVRGYERDFSSAAIALLKSLKSITAHVDVSDHLRVPQLVDLSSLSFAALRGIDTQCKLLRQCVQFVYFRPPSEACPTEYTDYQETRDSALATLTEIEGIRLKAQSGAQKAEQLDDARQALENQERTSGSTGGRRAVLQTRVTTLESNISETLAAISSQIDGVISDSTMRADQ